MPAFAGMTITAKRDLRASTGTARATFTVIPAERAQRSESRNPVDADPREPGVLDARFRGHDDHREA